jgi:hypothetical protein
MHYHFGQMGKLRLDFEENMAKRIIGDRAYVPDAELEAAVKTHLGAGLHAYQDDYSHQKGGQTAADGHTHWAQTWFHHAPKVLCGEAGYESSGVGAGMVVHGPVTSPECFGAFNDLACQQAKKSDPNWNNWSRPDDKHLFARDYDATIALTYQAIGRWMKTFLRCPCTKA